MNFFLRSVRIAPYGANGGERVKVLQWKEKHYVVDICGLHDTISLDRLKPAYSEQPKAASELTTSVSTPQLDSNAPALQLRSPSSSTGSTIPSRVTRTGRHVHWPQHLQDFVP